MDDRLGAHVAAVAALDEPTRRRLYEYVARQSAAVGRDDVAGAVGLARATVAFHLDKLVDEGLLEVRHERRSGRTGPGAGRPSKLYFRSARQVAVSLPERHYDLAGHLLAMAIEEADRSGASVRAELDRLACAVGAEMGRAGRAQGEDATDDVLFAALEAQGFEPRAADGRVLLGNCPFHRLAEQHTELVCGMNLSLLGGLLDGLGLTDLRARLDPLPDHCCVQLKPASA
ncbi:Predicted transcriptional regulator, ArsR family [Amycolatopsis marina]|uniref:Predicted transcriptional regulator, ArsR family n=1 Tax=Amycolatopsis marina TaxID=490629 RepID=A0A1I0X094_9PSEU|nr:helix-turn-helix domain-containing protein [Amycolatopsis marina]SFA93553.1 Predicted transcriptional regulator, ArsR family [Amycolatopsis marina]